jgi:hypothetical protein
LHPDRQLLVGEQYGLYLWFQCLMLSVCLDLLKALELSDEHLLYFTLTDATLIVPLGANSRGRNYVTTINHALERNQLFARLELRVVRVTANDLCEGRVGTRFVRANLRKGSHEEARTGWVHGHPVTVPQWLLNSAGVLAEAVLNEYALTIDSGTLHGLPWYVRPQQDRDGGVSSATLFPYSVMKPPSSTWCSPYSQAFGSATCVIRLDMNGYLTRLGEMVKTWHDLCNVIPATDRRFDDVTEIALRPWIETGRIVTMYGKADDVILLAGLTATDLKTLTTNLRRSLENAIGGQCSFGIANGGVSMTSRDFAHGSLDTLVSMKGSRGVGS